MVLGEMAVLWLPLLDEVYVVLFIDRRITRRTSPGSRSNAHREHHCVLADSTLLEVKARGSIDQAHRLKWPNGL